MKKSIFIKSFKMKRTMLIIWLIAFSFSNALLAQQKSVQGVVVDDSDYPLIGATIVVKSSGNGTITDADGKFTISAAVGDVLSIQYVGYKETTVTVDNRSQYRVVLAEDTQLIDEVVVVGYGVQKKSDVTGAMISISDKELTSRPVSNAFEAMQGKAAGVDITSNERPGEIGNIFIRGVRSLSAESTPLYVVDGIPLMSTAGIESLNPHDIESIDILKDASATAIYGSRGANGVIIVTTKRGKEGRFTLSYAGSVTAETLKDRTKMMDADEYITWRRWAYYYSDPNKYPRGDQPTQENDYTIFLGANDQYAWNNIMKGWSGGSWDGSKVETTDWTDNVTRTGISTEHTLSGSGGTEKMTAYGSFGYLNNQGTMMGQEYTRYTAKGSMDLTPTKWFSMGVTLNTSYSVQQYGQSNAGGQTSGPGSIYAAARNNLPYAVPYDNDGNRIVYPGGDDMIKTAINEWEYTDDERTTLRAVGSFYGMFDFGSLIPAVEGLKYRINFGPDFRYYRRGIFIDEQSVNRVGAPNLASKEHQQDFSWTLDNLVYYDRTFGKHTIGATLLQSATKYKYEQTYMRALDIPLPSQKWDALNKTNITALDDWNSSMSERQLLSYMARVNYSFADKYLLTASGRWDGASQLAEGNKWAFFPSVALGWRIDQEAFLQEVSWISQLKLRLGMGTTGNSAIKPYQTKGSIVSLFYPYGNTAIPGYSASESLISGGNVAMANKDLTWERTTQYNLGIDYSFLDGRISGILDLYTSKTKDLLMEMTIPALTGYTNTYANIGETSNIGFDLTLNTVNIRTRDFEWRSTINAAWQKDQIDILANGKEDDIVNGWFIGQATGYTENGRKYSGVYYNYASAGLWKEEDAAEMAKFNENGHNFQVGMARPVDQNNDYRIDPNNDRVIIGHTRPRWTVGMTNTFTYKDFELSIFFSGRLDFTYAASEWQGGRYVQRSISYYNENNKDADYQKPIYNVAGGDPYYNILGYRDGSFLKIRNISLGYTLPKKVANNMGLSNLKLYMQAKNPGMLFSNVDWVDLDLGGSTWNSGFTFGLNIDF